MKKWIALLIIKSEFAFAWSATFSPAERVAAPDLAPMIALTQWLSFGVSALLALGLVAYSGLRIARYGDQLGALMSLVGGMVCAMAPFIVRGFIL